MRFLGFAVASAFVLAACGGGDKAASTDSATPAATDVQAEAAAPAGEMAPITGTIHEVKMIGDASGYRFEPADITINAGDGIKWVFVSGGPHDVAFDPATLSPEAKAALVANMPEQMGELSGKMLLSDGETYTVSFTNVPAGKYDYVCTPHIAMGMKGTITVQ